MMQKRIDMRTLGIILLALAIGLAWAAYNLNVAGPFRNDTVVRNLVWAVFAGPFALFLGWIVARRHEIGIAAFCCFCLYFFSFFVAQRIEGLIVGAEAARATAHALYFQLMLVLHGLGGLGLAIWRAQIAPEQPAIPARS
jgi:hypothetical protein